MPSNIFWILRSFRSEEKLILVLQNHGRIQQFLLERSSKGGVKSDMGGYK